MQASKHWDDFRVVLAIAEAGSLAGAARTLGVNHATVYRRLEKLEARVGIRLFERAVGGYSATSAGETVVERARRMRDAAAEAERLLLGQTTSLTGTLRLTTTDALLNVAMPVLGDYRRAHPGIVLEVSTSTERQNLTRRDADVALRPTFSPPEHWVGKSLGEIPQAVYAPRSMVVETTTPWVGPDAAMGYRTLERWMTDQGLADCVSLRADATLGMASAIRAGLGQGVLPCYLADSMPDLRRVGAPIEALAIPLWLLTHPDMRRAASVRALFEALATGLVLA
ncbi:LysR family transcriptional regulator [Salinicola rhizosphaerae]|uniref:LysR family transcriptional regulator n=1 Tax=Salinicola rhizosphaerae TaxID=1443141 RepID=A0ABQ3DT44_9GAMM|nr:LysR family transcriptional regulator [Salinicola rhizosphaerae]GHB15041.1 LysR family transcriptional regulator [Salinicola rhizosphaerae]